VDALKHIQTFLTKQVLYREQKYQSGLPLLGVAFLRKLPLKLKAHTTHTLAQDTKLMLMVLNLRMKNAKAMES
jgi:hypothetical protein